MSTTGQTLGIVVGAVVGYVVGGPAGAFQGATYGSTIGLALDPPKQPKLQGPQLEDLTVQTATYGAVIPLIYGVNVVTGNIIWLENDRLAEVSSTTYSGGKGGPGQGTTNFSYQATFAVGLGKGPISSIRRVWVGSDLVYDVSPSASQATIDASLKLINGWTETVIDREEDVSDNQGTTYIDTPRDVTHPARAAFYTGSDAQNPDPRMQATLGVDNCPAYRGLAYMVFYDLDLTSYGNSLLGAQVKVELVQSTTVTTGDIIADLCERTGIIYAADIDRAALTSSVTGYRVTNIAAARAGIEQIQTAYPFDVIQDGYKIKFQPRGGSPVATIGWEDLDARGATQPEGVQLTVSREMDSILPRKVTVGYLDVDREQDASEQYAERLNVSTVNSTSVDIPIAMTATQAAGIAEVLLYLYWMERYEASFKLPASYNHLQPGDVVTVNTQTNSYEFRLVAVNYTSDGRVECSARYNSASVYVPVAAGYSGASTGGGIDIPSQTFTEYLDIPLIVEANNVPGFVVAMRGGEASWRAGSLFVTDDNGGTWADVKDLSSQAFIGTAQSILSARSVNDCGLIDKSSVLTVTPYPHVAALSSVTELQMFNGANLFAYGADGRWEIIAAQNCVLQIDGSYILTDLLRGRFGSEWATGLHAADDHVVSLAVGTSGFVTIESGKIGVNRIYRSVTSGRSLSTAGDYAFKCNAMNLEPLSPVYAKAYRAASQDWVMEWVRRTRIGGELRDLVDAQLGEVAESYDVLIYDATYTTLKRTISVTSPACTYTSAQQVTDFGGNQATIYARIYQNSAMVGRGRELQVTFTG